MRPSWIFSSALPTLRRLCGQPSARGEYKRRLVKVRLHTKITNITKQLLIIVSSEPQECSVREKDVGASLGW